MGDFYRSACSAPNSVNVQLNQRPLKRAAAWLALLGPVFYTAYGFANWWAASRLSVPTLAFAWERLIPFWAWTIFPYWTINIFYALSLFLARDRHTLDRHAARLLTATLLATVFFVVWPLRFGFGQPEVSGTPAFLFNALRAFDQPFNQAPSLHIALAVILWDWYRRFVHQPLWRLVLHLWVFAICASVLTTWQHHFIDIPTGLLGERHAAGDQHGACRLARATVFTGIQRDRVFLSHLTQLKRQRSAGRATTRCTGCGRDFGVAFGRRFV